MKIRNSFVSNSSSTSFIIEDKNYEEYKNMFNLYKVKDLYFFYKNIIDEINDLKKLLPDFMEEEFYCQHIPYWEEIRELNKINPEAYISDAEDRNQDWLNNFDLKVFEGDL